MAEKIIKGDLQEDIIHVGDLIIEGNVRREVKISIKGALHIKGSLGKDVTIIQRQANNKMSNTGHNNCIMINNNNHLISIINGLVTINGQRIDTNQEQPQNNEKSALQYGCKIDGICDAGAYIEGTSLKIGAITKGFVKAQDSCEVETASESDITAGNNISLGKAYNCQLNAANSITAEALISTQTEAGNNVTVSGDIDRGAVKAGNNITASYAKGVKLKAGNNITAPTLCGCPFIKAGNRVNGQIISPNMGWSR